MTIIIRPESESVAFFCLQSNGKRYTLNVNGGCYDEKSERVPA